MTKFQANRPVRVGTKMMQTDAKGEIKTPTVDQYAKELEALSEGARKVAAGKAETAEVEQSASTTETRASAPANKPAPKGK